MCKTIGWVICRSSICKNRKWFAPEYQKIRRLETFNSLFRGYSLQDQLQLSYQFHTRCTYWLGWNHVTSQSLFFDFQNSKKVQINVKSTSNEPFIRKLSTRIDKKYYKTYYFRSKLPQTLKTEIEFTILDQDYVTLRESANSVFGSKRNFDMVKWRKIRMIHPKITTRKS